MSCASFLRRLIGSTRRSESKPVRPSRLAVESLEDRLTPSAYTGPGDSWMGELHDDTLSLAQLSIPGTHDTMTYLPGGLVPAVRTQTMSLTDQLNAGVRFLDIRVGPGLSGDLGLYHGPVPLLGSFNTDVVKTCEDFLSAHPDETIVMSIQDDGSAGSGVVDSVMGSHVNGSDSSFWYTEDTVPTLGEARGKIVILNRWWGTTLSNDGIPFPIPNNTAGTYSGANDTFYVSARYEIGDNDTSLSAFISDKESDITDTLNLAHDETDSAWFITFTSAAGKNFDQVVWRGINPYSIAEGTVTGDIQGINNFLSGQSYDARVGSVLMDFVRTPVINQVIGANQFDAAPTTISLSSNSVSESRPAGTIVGTLATTDPDSGDSFTYSLASGGDNNLFTISGNQLKTAASFDFESRSSYSIRITSTDSGGLSLEKSFTIYVTNVNEAPTEITLSNSSVAENLQPFYGLVGRAYTTDPDAGNTFSYSLASGAGDSDSASFAIDGNGNLFNFKQFDFETRSSYSIRIRSTDAGGMWTEKVFTISVTNVNEAPTGIALTNSSVTENMPGGTAVGIITSTDPDAGDTHTYSLVDNIAYSANHMLFTLDSGGTLRTARGFDFETQKSYAILVRSTDAGGLFTEREFVIRVTDVNETPTGISLSNASVAENLPAGTVIGKLSTADPDAGDTHTYRFSGSSVYTPFNSQFTIDADGTLRAAAGFDFETRSIYPIYVRSTDAHGLWAEQGFTVTVTNVNEAPTAIALSNSNVAENQPAGTLIGRVSTTDPDTGDTHTYTLVGGDTGSFTVDDDGNLKTAAAFDFETKPSYGVRVRSTDAGGLFVEEDFTVDVTNLNEAPTLAVPGLQVAYEDVDQAIVGIKVGDPEGDSLTVKLVAGHGTLALGMTTGLTISGAGTGFVTLSGSATALNYALNTLSYHGAPNFAGDDWLSVSVSDGTLSTSGSVAIHVKSGAEQSADLRTTVNALQSAGVLNKGQTNALSVKLELKGNDGDVGRVQAFLNQVRAFLDTGILTQTQADALSGSGRILLLSTSRR